MRSVLNDPASALDTKTIRSLNQKVSNDEGDPKDVARNWLEDQGML
jgi:glycine betaine/choline ABC-type transport system substrate-binding protein